MLLRARHQHGRVVLLGPHMGRLAQVPPGERDDLAGHRGREQHGLPLRRAEPQDALDVGQEAEIERSCLLRRARARWPATSSGDLAWPGQEAGQGCRRRCRRGQGLDLRLIGTPPVQRHHLDAGARSGHPHVVGDLDRQFFWWHDDEGVGRGRRAVRTRGETLDSGMPKARSCPSRPGLADDVLPVERDRQRKLLDRGKPSRSRQHRAPGRLSSATPRSRKVLPTAAGSASASRPPASESRATLRLALRRIAGQ